MYATLSLSHASSPLQPYANRACDRCRRFKIKCRNVTSSSTFEHAPNEPCTQCHRTGSKCKYDESRPKRGKPTGQKSRGQTELYGETVLSFQSSTKPDAQQPPTGAAPTSPFITENTDSLETRPQEPDRVLLTESDSDQFLDSTSADQISLTSGLLESTQSCNHDQLGRSWRFPCADTASDLSYQLLEPENSYADFQHLLLDAPSASQRLTLEEASMQEMFSLVDSDQDKDIWPSIQQFFDTLYIIFPVLSYDDLLSRIVMEPDWNSVPDLRTLLLAIRMVNAAGEHRMTATNDSNLLNLIRQVERSRLCYEFTEPPTLDEVVISLFLFTAHNVLEKHNRAFLYLDETLSLMEVITQIGVEEERRRIQIGHVLFNTEAATFAIYADTGRKRRARRPSLNLDESLSASVRIGNSREADRMALQLLRRLTEVHIAKDAESLQLIDTTTETETNMLYNAAFQKHRYCRIQAADVAVTRQWQISCKLVAGKPQTTTVLRSIQSWVKNLGPAAMAWVCLLKEGEARILGLGKLSGLVRNISFLTSGDTCRYSVAGLIGAIIREDHEKAFAPGLANVVMPMALTIPAALRPIANHVMDNEGNYAEEENALNTGETVATDSMAQELPLGLDMLPTSGSTNDEQALNVITGDIDWYIDLY